MKRDNWSPMSNSQQVNDLVKLVGELITPANLATEMLVRWKGKAGRMDARSSVKETSVWKKKLTWIFLSLHTAAIQEYAPS